jgi:hypothetical protein
VRYKTDTISSYQSIENKARNGGGESQIHWLLLVFDSLLA